MPMGFIIFVAMVIMMLPRMKFDFSTGVAVTYLAFLLVIYCCFNRQIPKPVNKTIVDVPKSPTEPSKIDVPQVEIVPEDTSNVRMVYLWVILALIVVVGAVIWAIMRYLR
jgi:Ca2+/Na+ antiporter